MPKFAANLSMMFNEVPFLERFAAAANSGFTGVEYLFPYEFQAEVLAEQLRKHNLENVLFNLPPGNWAAGERGIACLPGREDEFRAGLATAIFKQIKLLEQNLRHPSLMAKKYDESQDLWQARVNKAWRFYFKIESDTYIIARIVPHPKK